VSWTVFDAHPQFPLYLEAGERGILRVYFGMPPGVDGEADNSHPLLGEAVRQLGEYFAGVRRAFDLPLDLRGTAFQLRVWNALLRIPYGETRTYGQLASALGRPGATRAVGAANGANPVGIIVPCHRVVAAGGGLGGFGGGLGRKRFLLALEAASCALPAR
jgi:methylated-DNA-[protein]-cysteine S-methyltransferase